MMNTYLIIVGLSAAIVAISAVVYFQRKASADAQIKNARKDAESIIEKARKDADRIRNKGHVDAQKTASKLRESAEGELKARRQSVNDIEKRVMQKERHLDERETHFNDREKQLESEFERVKNLKKKQESTTQDLLDTLEKAAGLSKDEAEKILMTNVERDMRSRAGSMIKKMTEEAKKIADRRAKEIVVDAIHRTALDHVAEATTSSVQLTDDEMKGRIIGKEGRNIRAFESITGVDVIIDETPGTVILSAFDPIRREIARMAMEKLIHDGRIHPTRIEEMVEKSKTELDGVIKERGERAAEELNLQFHPEIIKLLGKLFYRSSYGQNMLNHSCEAGHIAGIIAAQLDVNVNLAKRGAVLHDIGKALDFEQEGTHSDIGKEVCERYGESEELINCIMAHHEDEEPDTIEAIVVMMADAISSVRPGARRESMERYIKRLEKLETIASSYDGVEKVYAIQAGREIRVLVRPDEVDDPGIHKMAIDIAAQVESEVDYPGEVQVSIIRETRATGLAR